MREKEYLQARINELEGKLAEAHKEIGRLEERNEHLNRELLDKALRPYIPDPIEPLVPYPNPHPYPRPYPTYPYPTWEYIPKTITTSGGTIPIEETEGTLCTN